MKMSQKPISIEELDEMTSIERYIEALLDEFPNPITQKELAEKTAVTKSAISKVRSKIVALCNVTVLGYQKKLLLGSDQETFSRLLLFFFNRLKPQVFFKSSYLKSLIKKMDVHNKISKHLANLHYSDYFDEKDTNKFIEIILYNVSAIRLPSPYFRDEMLKRKMDESGFLMRFAAYVPIINDFFSNFEVAIFANDKELIDLLGLRDKVFYFIMHNSERILQDWEVVTDVKDADKKAVYIEAYLKVIDYYVRKFANHFTSKMATRAKEKRIDFESQYSDIGAFFKPSSVHKGDISQMGTKEEIHLSNPGYDESPLPSNE